MLGVGPCVFEKLFSSNSVAGTRTRILDFLNFWTHFWTPSCTQPASLVLSSPQSYLLAGGCRYRFLVDTGKPGTSFVYPRWACVDTHRASPCLQKKISRTSAHSSPALFFLLLRQVGCFPTSEVPSGARTTFQIKEEPGGRSSHNLRLTPSVHLACLCVTSPRDTRGLIACGRGQQAVGGACRGGRFSGRWAEPSPSSRTAAAAASPPTMGTCWSPDRRRWSPAASIVGRPSRRGLGASRLLRDPNLMWETGCVQGWKIWSLLGLTRDPLWVFSQGRLSTIPSHFVLRVPHARVVGEKVSRAGTVLSAAWEKPVCDTYLIFFISGITKTDCRERRSWGYVERQPLSGICVVPNRRPLARTTAPKFGHQCRRLLPLPGTSAPRTEAYQESARVLDCLPVSEVLS